MPSNCTPDEPICPACGSAVSLAGEEFPASWDELPDASVNLTCDQCGAHLHIETRIAFDAQETT